MLVLTRRVGEKVVIDDTIAVTVLSVRGGKVRIGVSAPALVRIDRQEVHERRDESAAKPVEPSAGGLPGGTRREETCR